MLKSELCLLPVSCMATMPSNHMQHARRKDMAEDSKPPTLIPRCPLPDAAVETDMKRRTLPPPSTVGSTHPSPMPIYGCSGSEGQKSVFTLQDDNPAPPMRWSHDMKSLSHDPSLHQPQIYRSHLSRTFSTGSSSLRGGGGSGMETAWQCSTKHVQNTHRQSDKACFEKLSTPQQIYELANLHSLGSEVELRYQNRRMSEPFAYGGTGHQIPTSALSADSPHDNGVGVSCVSAAVGGGGGVSGKHDCDPLGVVLPHSSLYSSAPTSLSTYRQGFSSPDQLGSNRLSPLDHPVLSNPSPSYPPSNYQPPMQHYSHLHTLPNSPHMPAPHQQPLHQHHAQPQSSVSPQLPGLNRFQRFPSDGCDVQQPLQHVYGSERGEIQPSYHQPCPLSSLPSPSSSSSGYPSLTGSEGVHSEDARRHQEAGGTRLKPHQHEQLTLYGRHLEQRPSPEVYSGQPHLSRYMGPARTELELPLFDSQPQGETSCESHLHSRPHYHPILQQQLEGGQFHSFPQQQPRSLEGEPYPHIQPRSLEGESYPHIQPRSLEGESYPHIQPRSLEGYSQQQQCLPERIPYPQRHQYPLKGDRYLQGQLTSLSLRDPRQYHRVSLHGPSTAISSSLEPLIHHHGDSPDQLVVDDYLAGETQRALSLHKSVKGAREITSRASGLSHSNFIEITEHPRDVHVKTHQRVLFKCKALLLTGHDKKVVVVDLLPQLQWYREEDLLIKEVTTDLVLSNVGVEDAGSYYCVVTHPQYPSISLHSNRAHLTVTSKLTKLDDVGGAGEHIGVTKAPMITRQPPSRVTAVLGTELRLTLEVKGEEPINFRWFKDSHQLSYCRTKELCYPSASHSEGGQYSCSVSNIHGSVLSDSFLVRVLRTTAKPRILVHPLSQHILYGQEVNLSVKVEENSQLCGFQWYKNHAPLEGMTDFKLVIGSAVGSDSGEYYCMVMNSGGSMDSNIAFVTVKDHRVPLSSDSYYMGGSGSMSHRESFWNRAAQPSQNQRQQQQQQQPFIRMHGCNVTGSGNETGLYLNMSARGDGGDLGGVHHPHKRGYSNVYDSMKEDNQPRGQGEGITSHPRSGGPGERMGGEPQKVLIEGECPSRSEDQEIHRAETARVMVPGPVGDRPTILEHPQSQDVDLGGPLSLSCRAMGPENVVYLWYFNGLSLITETRPEYFINCFTDEDEGVYFCRVSNCCGEVDSRMAHVKMKDDD